jgi:hypothetical protein
MCRHGLVDLIVHLKLVTFHPFSISDENYVSMGYIAAWHKTFNAGDAGCQTMAPNGLEIATMTQLIRLKVLFTMIAHSQTKRMF